MNCEVVSLSGDKEQILPCLITHEDPTRLWAGAYPDNVASLLSTLYQQMDVVRVSPETESVVLVSDGCPTPLTMVRDGATWKVDADPLIRIADAQGRSLH